MTEQTNNTAELVAVEAEPKVNVLTKAKNFIGTHKKEVAIAGIVTTIGVATIARLAWMKDSELTEPEAELFESQGNDLIEDVAPIELDSTDEDIITEIEETLAAEEA